MLYNKHNFVKIDSKIYLEKETLDEIDQFVEQIDTKRYNFRNQANDKKKKKDQIAGKIAEFGTYLFFSSQGLECSKPDMNIYKTNKKSFNPDMTIDGLAVHCKSCHKDSRYPMSWVFQSNDIHKMSGKDKEFYNKEKEGLIVCCVVDHKDRSVTIKWLVDKNYAIDILEPPKMPQLLNIKECLYNKRLEIEQEIKKVV